MNFATSPAAGQELPFAAGVGVARALGLFDGVSETLVAEEQATLLEQLGVPQDSESSEEPAEEEAVTV